MSSEDEVMDDGLHIKPPQHHHRHKDRKRDRSHRHPQKPSRKDNVHPLGGGAGGGTSGAGGSGDIRRERRHHHRDEEQRGGGGGRHRQLERGVVDRHERESRGSGSSSSKHRSSSSRKRGDEEKPGNPRDMVLYEVKKERRNIELENERALRDIERRREKEKAAGDPFGDGGRHSRREKRSHRDRDRDRGEGERERRRPATPPEEVEIVEEKEESFVDERIHLEVQDIEDSASDREEGERSTSPHSKEEQVHGDASDKSDVSSASDNEAEEKPEEPKATSDVSSSASSRKSNNSDGKSEVSSSSSSSSDSDSDQESEARNGEDGLKPPKVPRKESPPPSPVDVANEKNPGISKPASEDSREIPCVVITADEEEEEEDLLPPYYPALQGCRRVEEFQLLNRIEEGTYGVVYRAKEKRTDEVVALKRLKMEKEKDGFPITSLREINTLLKAQHENIVTVREIVVGSNTDKIFLVMDYVEHDLKALMETLKLKGQVFLPEEVKCLMIQLLRAVAHLHDNWILHRDLKTSNLLLSHKGILKVGDFGLAREYGSPLKSYTPIVVTLWYRAPELLLGPKEYSTPIDVWSVGCIFGELLKMEPMFPGKSEPNQLNLIFQSLGTPNDRIWPGYSQLPLLQKMTFADYPVNKLKTRFGHLTDQGIDLMNKFLTFNPAKRITAEDALDHAFFKEMPVAIDPSMFPTWPAKSELGHRKAAASPKPPSGGHQFKGTKEDEDPAGFFLGGGDARRQPLGAGFSLRF